MYKKKASVLYMALELVKVDKARFYDAVEMYFLWKELDQRIIIYSNNQGMTFNPYKYCIFLQF